MNMTCMTNTVMDGDIVKIINMKDIRVVINDLTKELEDIPELCDLSDVGNVIGIVIGKHLSDEMGYEKEDFLTGLNHGFSLADGTH